jgi:uncharacterized protein YecA (UPF0149 family)
MSFLEKVMKTAEQAAETVKGGVQDLQTRNEIVRTYENLGKKAFELMDKKELANPELEPFADRIRQLKSKLAEAERAGWEPQEPEGPPEA